MGCPANRPSPGGAMPTSATSDPRAWRADTLDAPTSWYYPLSDRALAVLDRAVHGWTPESRPLTELKPSDELRAASKDEIDRAHAALEEGRGFAVVTVPPGRYSPQELTAAYWLVGQLLGRPF